MRSDARKALAATVSRMRPEISATPMVGMIGKKRAGKDTVAGVLTSEFGFRRFAFADPLREAALHLNPYIGGPARKPYRLSEVVDAAGWEVAKAIPEVRRTLQEYGVAIREIDPEFWIRATMTPAMGHAGAVVITDVRFPNEAEAVKGVGGVLIRVTRPGLDESDQHVSETALDGFEADVNLDNSGTIEDLQEKVRAHFAKPSP